MRTLVLYESKTGSTKKYAEEIARSVNGDILPAKKFKAKMIQDYDTFVFGGWVMGGKIQGLDRFLSFYDEMKEGHDILIFACGMSIVSKEARDSLISSNILDLYHVRFYQLRGSFDYQKLNLVNKILMSNSLRMIDKDPKASFDQKALLDIKEHPIEYYDRAGLDRIISVLHKLSAIGGEA